MTDVSKAGEPESMKRTVLVLDSFMTYREIGGGIRCCSSTATR